MHPLEGMIASISGLHGFDVHVGHLDIEIEFLSYSPMIFTSTRFFRLPSNSP
jgi:hypothetical protein